MHCKCMAAIYKQDRVIPYSPYRIDKLTWYIDRNDCMHAVHHASVI